MPILDYTTKVDVYKSVGEIQAMLAKHGASKVLQEYGAHGTVTSLSFEIQTLGGARYFRLPSRQDAVLNAMKKQGVKCDEAQAYRVAWRIIKDWTEVQMALLESEQAEIDEIFLPYMTNNEGKTIYELYKSNQLLLKE